MDALAAAVAETISSYPDLVAACLQQQPKAWGALAGRGVQAYQAHLGRKLTESERRRVWQALWDALERLR